MDRWTDSRAWAAALAEFTRRNAGRTTILEEDGLDIGAQESERAFPLRGVAYDPKDARVEIMLGNQASMEHLTRTVEGAEEIDILRDDQDRDRVLRIAHRGGQTLLRIL
jgi:hypothetical protein